MCRAETGRERRLYDIFFSFPPPFSEDYGHMMTAAQHNAENRKSSLVLVTGLTGILYDILCSTIQYNTMISSALVPDTITHYLQSYIQWR